VSDDWAACVEGTARRYRSRAHRGFVAGKLKHDPVYAALFADPDLAHACSVLDLGCGRGILLALLAERAHRRRRQLALHGVEARSSHAAAAAKALGTDARIATADVRGASLPRCEAACLIDVLHYLPGEAQLPLLQRIASALAPEGVLFVREIDRGAGLRGSLARLAEHAASALRGEPGRRFAFRTAAAWRGLLEAAGFSVRTRSADEGTPFANVLLVGTRRVSGEQGRA
jgi:SAM-dependent methyltransferase